MLKSLLRLNVIARKLTISAELEYVEHKRGISMQNKQGASVNVCVTRLRLSQQSSRFKRLPLAAAGTPTLLSSRWRIYCNQTLIGNRVLRALGDKALPSGRTHTKITRYARNLQTHTRRLRGANQSLSPATLKFHSRKTSQYVTPAILEKPVNSRQSASFITQFL